MVHNVKDYFAAATPIMSVNEKIAAVRLLLVAFLMRTFIQPQIDFAPGRCHA